MQRRVWPILLAIAAILVFASYLYYTQILVREIRDQAALTSRIYFLVQRGRLSNTTGSGEAELSLIDIMEALQDRDVPMVYFNAGGDVAAAVNLPFDPDLASPAGRRTVAEFAAGLENRHPENKVIVAGVGSVYFGEPALLSTLRWVPWLQVGAGAVLVLVAAAFLRADLRAEREKLWAAMARELAHQMGTPLSSLAGWIEVLALPDHEREAMVSDARMAEVIRTDVERLERVSRRFELIGKPQVLDIVRIEDIIKELEHYFHPRLPKLGNGIALRSRVRNGVPPVRANRVLLAWALENVVKNAVDALGGRGGRILIASQAGNDGKVHVYIADDGPGIPAHLRERIFEPGVSTKAGGWGVGLSLARRIVQELHGGRIVVRTRRRGGAVFDITLPAAGEASA
ncbi:MAG: sensor histidine kinase [Longimicrobiales bacterium]